MKFSIPSGSAGSSGPNSADTTVPSSSRPVVTAWAPGSPYRLLLVVYRVGKFPTTALNGGP